MPVQVRKQGQNVTVEVTFAGPDVLALPAAERVPRALLRAFDALAEAMRSGTVSDADIDAQAAEQAAAAQARAAARKAARVTGNL